jgi:hypothetical protein
MKIIKTEKLSQVLLRTILIPLVTLAISPGMAADVGSPVQLLPAKDLSGFTVWTRLMTSVI